MNAPLAFRGLTRGILAAAIALLSACGGGGGGGGAPPAIPAAPLGVVAVGGPTQILITWNDSPGATSYNIYMATAMGVTPTNTPPLAGWMPHPNVTSPFIHTGLVNGTTYYFIVTAVNSLGESAPSAEFSAAPAPFTGPVTALMPAVAAGKSHSLYLKSDGTVWAWGRNNQRQVGNGSRQNTNAPFMVTEPVSVPPITNQGAYTAIAGGGAHSLALKSDGTVWAWGDSGFGQLGNGTFANSGVPVQVLGLTGATAIAAGGSHSLAVKNDGTIWAWGSNGTGQLGTGGFGGTSSIPVQVTGLTGMTMTKVAAGEFHSLALGNAGAVWAWGGNGSGQLGDTTTASSNVPVAVSLPGGSVMTAISTQARHSMAIRNDGTLYVWGENLSGQLGNGTLTNSSAPIAVTGFTTAAPATAIGAGGAHSLAVRGGASPGVLGWGDNGTGQVGDGTTVNRTAPVSVTGLTGTFTMVSAGGTHSLALRNDGTVWAWGDKTLGQLGDGSYTDRNRPVQVSGLTGVTAIATGGDFGIALRMNGAIGEVWTWGNNNNGRLGDGTSVVNRNTPVQVSTVSGLTNAVAIGGGGSHALALDISGTLYAWGDNTYGQLAANPLTLPNSNVPVPVAGLTGVTTLSPGGSHSLVLLNDGTLRSWGDNSLGQLGDGTSIQRTAPVQVAGLSVVTEIAAKGDNSYALPTDGMARAWGANSSGQLGNGTFIGSSVPGSVSGLSTVTAISAGGAHAMALLSGGTLWAWGDNGSGELGDGTTRNRTLPVQVLGLTGTLTRIASGGSFNVVLLSTGTLLSWGDNTFGQLGNGTSGYSSTPVSVP